MERPGPQDRVGGTPPAKPRQSPGGRAGTTQQGAKGKSPQQGKGREIRQAGSNQGQWCSLASHPHPSRPGAAEGPAAPLWPANSPAPTGPKPGQQGETSPAAPPATHREKGPHRAGNQGKSPPNGEPEGESRGPNTPEPSTRQTHPKQQRWLMADGATAACPLALIFPWPLRVRLRQVRPGLPTAPGRKKLQSRRTVEKFTKDGEIRTKDKA